VNQLEMVSLGLSAQNGLEERPKPLIPRASAEQIDFLADALFGGEAKHGVETLIRGAHCKLVIQHEQSFTIG
jgi:hypothetical protein